MVVVVAVVVVRRRGGGGAGLAEGARAVAAAPPGRALHGPAALGLGLRLAALPPARPPDRSATAETLPFIGPPRRLAPLVGERGTRRRDVSAPPPVRVEAGRKGGGVVLRRRGFPSLAAREG